MRQYFRERRQCEVPRNLLPRTPVNKGSKPRYVGYIEPLRGRKILAREGASAYERASPKRKEQEYPRVGRGTLLQQRAVLRGPRLPRPGGHLPGAQGQEQWRGPLHLRDDRRSRDSRERRTTRKLDTVGRGSK